MAVKKQPAPYAQLYSGDFPVGANYQQAWIPVRCAEHHFEYLKTGVACSCAPGPAIHMLMTAAREICAGGQRGGMKSETGRGWLMKGNPYEPQDHAVNQSYVNHPQYRALVLRENEKDLADWLSRAKMLYGKLGATVTEKPARVSWPSGATFVCGHLKDDSAWTDYQGQEFHRMVFEELTQIPKELLYELVIASCRSTFLCRDGCVRGQCRCGVLVPQVFTTTNPGGPGHGWVKNRFVSLGQPNVVYKTGGGTRIFIPSRLEDNPYLMRDEAYKAALENISDDNMRRAWRYGDWDIAAGQYFPTFRVKPNPDEPPEARHVIPTGSRVLLPWWPRWLSMDWGFKHHAACHVWCYDQQQGQTIAYREHGFTGTGSTEIGESIAKALLPDLERARSAGANPNFNLYLSPEQFGKRDEGDTVPELLAKGIQRVLGPDSVYIPELWGDGGNPGREFAAQRKLGVTIQRAKNARVPGWQTMREMMRWKPLAQPAMDKFDPEYAAILFQQDPLRWQRYNEAFQAPKKREILPKLLIYDSCPGLIKGIVEAVHKDETEDVLKTDTPGDDFLESGRYGVHSFDPTKAKEPDGVYVQRMVSEAGATDMNSVYMISRHAEEQLKLAGNNSSGLVLGRMSGRRAKMRVN